MLTSRSNKIAMVFDYFDNYSLVHNYVKYMDVTLCHFCIHKIMTSSMMSLFADPKYLP